MPAGLSGTDALELVLMSKKSKAHKYSVRSVAFSPDGTKIVSGANDGTIKVWDFGAPRALLPLLGQN